MKKIIISLNIILIILLASCNYFNESESILSTTLDEKKEIIDYDDDIKLVEISYDEEVNSIYTLAKKIDYLIFNSNGINDFEIVVGDDLKDLLKADLKNTIINTAYTGSLTSNFFYSYDTSDIDNNILKINAGFNNTFATTTIEYEKEEKYYSLDYFLNVKNKNMNNNFTLTDLPLFANDLDYVMVSNSEELYFVLEEGYLPYAKKESVAYKYLEKATNILSTLITKDMSDLDKYKNIFNYVIFENQYDYNTLINVVNQGKTNKSFYIEGTMDNNLAVCSGLVKEIVLLSRLAGIESYHVGAKGNESGHAYLYIRIDDNYYLSCPTYSMLRYPYNDKYISYHTYQYFLTTLKTNNPSWEYESYSFPEIKKNIENEKYDYWKNLMFDIDDKKISLSIDNKLDAVALFNYSASLAKKYKINLEIELNGDYQVLKDAYNEVKDILDISLPLSTSSFNSKRLNVYEFKGE